jgi:hypothetical protein
MLEREAERVDVNGPDILFVKRKDSLEPVERPSLDDFGDAEVGGEE